MLYINYMTDNMLTFFFSKTHEPGLGCHVASRDNDVQHGESELCYREPLCLCQNSTKYFLECFIALKKNSKRVFPTHFVQILGFSFIPHHEWFTKCIQKFSAAQWVDLEIPRPIFIAQSILGCVCMGACMWVREWVCTHVHACIHTYVPVNIETRDQFLQFFNRNHLYCF